MKFKTIHLLIVFVVLLGAVFLTRYLNQKNEQGTMKTSFFELNIEDIREFIITPMHRQDRQFRVVKQNGQWMIDLGNSMLAETNPQFMDKCLKELKKLTPSRLATTNKEKWPQYAVDSVGTILEIIEENTQHSIILGSLTFQDGRMVNTYVRIPGEDEVYAAEAYMEGTFKAKPSQWRNKGFIQLAKNNWQKINFNSSGGKNKTMVKNENGWSLQGNTVDSSLFSPVFSMLESLKTQSFADITLMQQISSPVFSLSIEGAESQSGPTLNYYLVGNSWLVSSSINDGNILEIKSEDVEPVLDLFDPAVE